MQFENFNSERSNDFFSLYEDFIFFLKIAPNFTKMVPKEI